MLTINWINLPPAPRMRSSVIDAKPGDERRKHMKPESVTVKNIEAAFAGESMAHIKYLYFARICRARGDVETAGVFEETAAQEVQHAFGHLDLLYPPVETNPARCLEMAIAGEAYEYTERDP